jgi:hypothetical protein
VRRVSSIRLRYAPDAVLGKLLVRGGPSTRPQSPTVT